MAIIANKLNHQWNEFERSSTDRFEIHSIFLPLMKQDDTGSTWKRTLPRFLLSQTNFILKYTRKKMPQAIIQDSEDSDSENDERIEILAEGADGSVLVLMRDEFYAQQEYFTECFNKLDTAIVRVLALSSNDDFECSEMRAKIAAASRSASYKGKVIVHLKHFEKAEFYPVCGIDGFLASKHYEVENGELNRERAVDIIRAIQISSCRERTIQNIRHGSMISKIVLPLE